MKPFDCLTLIEQKICKSDCCGAVLFKKEFWESNKQFAQRKVEEIVPAQDNNIYVATDGLECIFLNNELRCAIYDKRPDVCRNYGLQSNLECPYFNIKGNLRSPAKQRRQQRIINHQVDDFFKEVEKWRNKKQLGLDTKIKKQEP